MQQEIHQITLFGGAFRGRIRRWDRSQCHGSRSGLVLQRRIPIDEPLLIDAEPFGNETDPLFTLDGVFALLQDFQDFVDAADSSLDRAAFSGF